MALRGSQIAGIGAVLIGQIRAGEQFAGYQIVRRLGVGGMGEVYLANHPRLPRQDALKVLAPMFQNDLQFRDRFNREADIASGLLHPNIVPLHDRGEFQERLWISMAYIDGADVAALAGDKPDRVLPPQLTISVATAVGDALDHAHENGLLHRDVKPGNILVTAGRRPRIYLADFGIAKPQDGGTSLTSTGAFIGSLAYCAPEQAAADRDLTGAADQYQLACTIFEMLTGTTPFPGTSLVAVLHKHLTAAPPKPRERRADLPGALDEVFARALAKEPDDRYKSCAEFADDLASAMSKAEEPATVAVWSEPRVVSVEPDPDVGFPGDPWTTPTQMSTPHPSATLPDKVSSTRNTTERNESRGLGYTPPPAGLGSMYWARLDHSLERVRGLACGAYFVATTPGDAVDALSVLAPVTKPAKVLHDQWGIYDSRSAKDVIAGLIDGRETPPFDHALAEIHAAWPGIDQHTRMNLFADRERVRAMSAMTRRSILDTCIVVVSSSRRFPDRVPTSVVAWDLSCAVSVTRHCMLAGYVDDDHAWRRMVQIGRQAAKQYPTWVDYAVGFDVGRALASAVHSDRPINAADASFEQTRGVLGRLLDDAASPWVRIPLH